MSKHIFGIEARGILTERFKLLKGLNDMQSEELFTLVPDLPT